MSVKSTIIPQLTNHIGFVIDGSGSMQGLSSKVVSVFDAQIDYLRKRSQELNQETRVSVYIFDYTTQCVVYDMDVMRPIKLGEFYQPHGQTALLDATNTGISELSLLPEIHGDHSFMVYVITDGEENNSKIKPGVLALKLKDLPENWTVACLVPNLNGKREAKNFGFPEGNIEIWDTTTRGLEEVERSTSKVLNNYMVNRAAGVRGTKNLFHLDTVVKLAEKTVKANLDTLPSDEYLTFPVYAEDRIDEFVTRVTRKAYRTGSAYYRLDKTETIQAQKQLVLRQKQSGKVYYGAAARETLGLPDYTLKVAPTNHGTWDIFVQSTSTNRKLLPGTEVLVLR